MVWLLGMAVGLVAFLCIFGVHVLDVTYTDWLLAEAGAFAVIVSLPVGGALLYCRSRRRGEDPQARRYSPRADRNWQSRRFGASRV